MKTNKRPAEWEESRTPKIAVAVIAILMVGLTFILFNRREPEPRSEPAQNFEETQQAIFGQMMGISEDGVTVYVPPDSINLEGTVVITPVTSNRLQVAEEIGWTRPKVVMVEFRTSQGNAVDKASFFKPIHICFDLTEDQWQDLLLHPDAYQVQYYSEQPGPAQWLSLPKTTYPDKFQLCGNTTNLSMFSLAIRSEVEIPVTGATARPTSVTITPVTPTTRPQVTQPAPTKDNDQRQRTPVATDVRSTDPVPTEPPATEPATEPPTEPPVTEPPTEPPTDVPTDPPATDPPATDPPATDAPTQPPV